MKNFSPTRVLEVDITEGIRDYPGLRRYKDALILVKSHGVPVGCLRIPCHDGGLHAQDIRLAIENDWAIGDRISREALMRWLTKHDHRAITTPLSWSVIICTRNRADSLKRCLDSIMRSDETPGGEIIVVDNNPTNDSTRECVSRYPQVRYVVEPRQGLNWARSRGVREARGDVIIFTDDDVAVDRRWISALLEPFSVPRVGAVCGLTMPAEIEKPAQGFFEDYGGHSRGFSRRAFDCVNFTPAAAGQIGSGANMAFRRTIALEMEFFHNEMDVGTVTLSGGDTYAFYRVLAAGYQIIYTPAALAWHFHRGDEAAVERMLYGYSVGGFCVLTRILMEHRDPHALKVAFCWLKHHHIRQLRKALLRWRGCMPLKLVVTEWRGALRGPAAYFKARRKEARR